MRVGLDAQLTVGTGTGIGEYVEGLIRALPDAGVDVALLRCPAFDPWRFDRRVVWDQVLLPLAARRARVDLVHCASGTMPFASPAPVVVTVHDIAWLRVQAHVRAYARAYFGRFQLARYRHARRILVDSQFSRAELLTFAPLAAERVEVVYPGVAADIGQLARRPAPEAYVLVVGTVERRKNLEILIRALAELPATRLVAVGPFTSYRDECERLARACGVAERVRFEGYVPRATLLERYATAAVVALPSRYEGFGYAAAQALCAGVPLVAADATSLPEVIDGAAPLVAPDDLAGWVAALRAVLTDRAAAERHASAARAAARRRFAWAGVAARVAGAYQRALA